VDWPFRFWLSIKAKNGWVELSWPLFEHL
jgi:hypothetical protein